MKQRSAFVLCCAVVLSWGVVRPAHAQFLGEILWWVSRAVELKDPDASTQAEIEAVPTPDFVGKDKNPFPVNEQPRVVQPIQVVEPTKPQVDQRQIEGNRILKEIRTYMARNQVLLPNVEDIVVEGFLQGAQGAQALINGNWRVVGDQITVTSSKHQKFSILVDRLAEISPTLMENLESDLQTLEATSNAFLLEIDKIEPNLITLKDTQGSAYELSF